MLGEPSRMLGSLVTTTWGVLSYLRSKNRLSVSLLRSMGVGSSAGGAGSSIGGEGTTGSCVGGAEGSGTCTGGDSCGASMKYKGRSGSEGGSAGSGVGSNT